MPNGFPLPVPPMIGQGGPPLPSMPEMLRIMAERRKPSVPERMERIVEELEEVREDEPRLSEIISKALSALRGASTRAGKEEEGSLRSPARGPSGGGLRRPYFGEQS